MSEVREDTVGDYQPVLHVELSNAPPPLDDLVRQLRKTFLTLRSPTRIHKGLNADLLDGYHASDFVRQSGSGGTALATNDNIPEGETVDLQWPAADGTAAAFASFPPPDNSYPVAHDDGTLTTLGPSADRLIGYDGTTPATIAAGSGVTISGGVISATGSGGTVTDVTATTPISSSGGTTPNITHDDSAVTPGSHTYASITVDQKGHVTAVSSGTSPVTSVGATSPIASSGGATPTISHNDSAVTPGSYTNVSATVDAKGHVTAMSSGAAPVTSVGGTAPVASSGGTTPTISMAAATAGNDGYMTGVYAGKLDGIESGADVTDSDNVATALDGLSTSGSPTLVDSDYVAIYTGGAWLRITLAQLKAYVLA